MTDRSPGYRQGLEEEKAGLETRLKSGAGDPETLKRRIGEIDEQLSGGAKTTKRAAVKETRGE